MWDNWTFKFKTPDAIQIKFKIKINFTRPSYDIVIIACAVEKMTELIYIGVKC